MSHEECNVVQYYICKSPLSHLKTWDWTHFKNLKAHSKLNLKIDKRSRFHQQNVAIKIHHFAFFGAHSVHNFSKTLEEEDFFKKNEVHLSTLLTLISPSYFEDVKHGGGAKSSHQPFFNIFEFQKYVKYSTQNSTLTALKSALKLEIFSIKNLWTAYWPV